MPRGLAAMIDDGEAMKILLVCALALGACGASPAAPASLPTVHMWGAVKFTQVRAFRTNWADESSLARIRSKDGTLNPTRLPVEGIPLDASQIQRLRRALVGTEDFGAAGCFMPHHAFVLYAPDGAIAGTVDVCFSCQNAYGTPDGLVANVHWGLLRQLVEELGMPLHDESWSLK